VLALEVPFLLLKSAAELQFPSSVSIGANCCIESLDCGVKLGVRLGVELGRELGVELSVELAESIEAFTSVLISLREALPLGGPAPAGVASRPILLVMGFGVSLRCKLCKG